MAWLRQRIAQEPAGRRRAMLENYLEHLQAEVSGDLERIMATMTAEPVYRSFTPSSDGEGPRGQAETRAQYRYLFDNRLNLLERTFDRVMVSDDHIFSDGRIHQIFPGEVLAARGLDVDRDAWYLYSYRIAAVLPYEGDGTDVRMAGEDTYTPGMPTLDRVVRLEPEEVPETLLAPTDR